jgi:hypothetical protein
VLPIWGKVRHWGLYRRALPGLNAAGVGLIIASVFSLTLGALSVSDFKSTSICIGIVAFTAVDQVCVGWEAGELQSAHACASCCDRSCCPQATLTHTPSALLLLSLLLPHDDQLKIFEPAVVVGGGVIGVIAWAAKMM